jgi:predicted site-specific integrase-resolvase
MMLTGWARRAGIHPRTSRRWFHRGILPVPTRQLPTGTILVDARPEANGAGAALYARVSSWDQKNDLDRQVTRLSAWTTWTTCHGLIVVRAEVEVGSGLNGRRRRLMRLLADPTISTIVVEHRDRLARFRVEYLEGPGPARGRHRSWGNYRRPGAGHGGRPHGVLRAPVWPPIGADPDVTRGDRHEGGPPVPPTSAPGLVRASGPGRAPIMQRTYETRLPSDLARDPILDAYVALYGRAERTLFARLRAGEPLAALKRECLVRFGLTARQFNALAADLQGKISSVRKRPPGLMRSLERRIARAREVLRDIPRGTDTYHQKRRRLTRLAQRLQTLRADEASGRIRLCFGSRKLFRAQFTLSATGYASHEAWRRVWRSARSHQFSVLGSKDETAGCQGCVATVETDGSITLRLRLLTRSPHGKYVLIPGLRFRYGRDCRHLSPTKEDWQAILWRFVRDRRGWRVLVTVSVTPGEWSSVDGGGVVPVDLNATHVAVTELDRFGNPIAAVRVPCATRGKTFPQVRAAIGEAVSQVVTSACLGWKPIVADRLDFEKKKAELDQRGARDARLLSGFAYATFHAMLSARCYDAGIALQRVNPAYNSVIGTYTFADRSGLSRHQAAATSIGWDASLSPAREPPALLLGSCVWTVRKRPESQERCTAPG